MSEEKLWEVRSTNTTILRTYVRAYTREDAKRLALDKQFEEVSNVSKLTANQAWYRTTESERVSNTPTNSNEGEK